MKLFSTFLQESKESTDYPTPHGYTRLNEIGMPKSIAEHFKSHPGFNSDIHHESQFSKFHNKIDHTATFQDKPSYKRAGLSSLIGSRHNILIDHKTGKTIAASSPIGHGYGDQENHHLYIGKKDETTGKIGYHKTNHSLHADELGAHFLNKAKAYKEKNPDADIRLHHIDLKDTRSNEERTTEQVAAKKDLQQYSKDAYERKMKDSKGPFNFFTDVKRNKNPEWNHGNPNWTND